MTHTNSSRFIPIQNRPFRNESSKLCSGSEAVASYVCLRCSYVIRFSGILCRLLNQCSKQSSLFRVGVAYREHPAWRRGNIYRVKVMIQFVSQVLPASSENACSNWLELAVMAEKPLRVMMTLPSNSSWS